MSEAWQTALVVVIQGVALAYLVSRFWPRRGTRPSRRPDVPVSSLTRRKRPPLDP